MYYGDKSARSARAVASTPAPQAYTSRAPASTCPPVEPPPSPACCNLVCFDRPRFFCGHLLTDDDLSLGQRYQIEKNKLYHRSLHGSGVVCGLRLTCDPVCAGGILVGEGFAIDDCGNDLVVCGPTPVDVVGQLQEKGYLLGAPSTDPCEPPVTPADCNVRQCFFVTACYVEEEHDFTTPLTPGCGPSPRECQATRIRESVRFEIVNDMPVSKGPLFDLRCRIEACFGLLTEGLFASALRDQLVSVATVGSATAAQNQQFWEEFCKLRGLLLLYLESHPDHYNCTIEDDIRAIQFPQASDNDYGTKVRDAFCRIIELAYQHVLSCAFGALTFSCSEPRPASCILLGTVEVCNGRVVRVCNCPRWYVWSFTSFFQVLFATLFESRACESVEQVGHDPASTTPRTTNAGTTVRGWGKTAAEDCGCGKSPLPATCCREFHIDNCTAFVRNMLASGRSVADVATAPLTLITELTNSLQASLDPTSQTWMSSKMFVDLNEQQANELAKNMGVSVRIEPAPTEFAAYEPVRTFLGGLQAGPGSSFRLFKRGTTIVRADFEPDLYARITALEAELAAMKAQTPDPGAAPAAARRESGPARGTRSRPKTNGTAGAGEEGGEK